MHCSMCSMLNANELQILYNFFNVQSVSVILKCRRAERTKFFFYTKCWFNRFGSFKQTQ